MSDLKAIYHRSSNITTDIDISKHRDVSCIIALCLLRGLHDSMLVSDQLSDNDVKDRSDVRGSSLNELTKKDVLACASGVLA